MKFSALDRTKIRVLGAVSSDGVLGFSAKPQPMHPQSVSHGSTTRVAAACSVLVGPMARVQKRQSGSLRQRRPISAWLISAGVSWTSPRVGPGSSCSGRGFVLFPTPNRPRKMEKLGPHANFRGGRLFLSLRRGTWAQPKRTFPACGLGNHLFMTVAPHSEQRFPTFPCSCRHPSPEARGSCDQTCSARVQTPSPVSSLGP